MFVNKDKDSLQTVLQKYGKMKKKQSYYVISNWLPATAAEDN